MRICTRCYSTTDALSIVDLSATSHFWCGSLIFNWGRLLFHICTFQCCLDMNTTVVACSNKSVMLLSTWMKALFPAWRKHLGRSIAQCDKKKEGKVVHQARTCQVSLGLVFPIGKGLLNFFHLLCVLCFLRDASRPDKISRDTWFNLNSKTAYLSTLTSGNYSTLFDINVTHG